MDSESAPPTVYDIPPEFLNRDDSDLVIECTQTDDAGTTHITHFRVHKLVLSMASESYFGSMFALPQAAPVDGRSILRVGVDRKDANGRVILPWMENPADVELLLTVCYTQPLLLPSGPALFSTLSNVLELSHKYQMPAVERILQQRLATHIQADRYRAYFMACRFQFRDEALMAARATLSHSFLPNRLTEMDNVPSSMMFRLLEYRRKCGVALGELGSTTRWLWIQKEDWKFSCGDCPEEWRGCTIANAEVQRLPSWFRDFMKGVGVGLENTPSIAHVQDAAFLSPYLERAACCANCLPKLGNFLQFINKPLKDEVERIVSEVTIYLPF